MQLLRSIVVAIPFVLAAVLVALLSALLAVPR
jgi:hypothetical protein